MSLEWSQCNITIDAICKPVSAAASFTTDMENPNKATSHVYRKGLGTEGNHHIFRKKNSHKNKDLAGKWGRLWLLALYVHDMMHLELVNATRSFYDPSHAYMKSLGTSSKQIWAILIRHHHIFRVKTVTNTRIGMVCAWYDAFEVGGCLQELLWSISCIEKRFGNISRKNMGAPYLQVTSASPARKTPQKWGSGWQMSSDFGTVCTWYDAFEVVGCNYELLWSS